MYLPFFRLPLVAWALTLPLAIGCSHAQPQAAAVPQAPPFEFVGEWGVRGTDPGQLADPIGPAVDTAGRVYFVDRASSLVQKFEASGVPLLSFEDSAVRHASAVAVDSGGGIYVADASAGQIRVYFPEGDLLRVFRMAPQRNFAGPFTFSVAADGALFVPDPAGGRVQVLGRLGQIERIWRVPPDAAGKRAMPVAAVAGPDGFVYVGDAGAGRVVKFTRGGAQAGSWDDSAGSDAPLLDLAVSSKYVFALRGASPRVVVWTLDGQHVLSDNLDGRLDSLAQGGGSLALSPDGELVVLDPVVPIVLRFRVHF
jgi:DNA-binding beta-propeller fold protein YncE